ncbi:MULTISPECIES: hypothetical protein [unclassified Nocardia]|uniref:hypothetical protein n=1 Tax=unclassified Nocardia TaxID=2637762 RepID=UPI001CE4645C|nr:MULTISPECIES: hypothetical protein [unclassified Nocardia]
MPDNGIRRTALSTRTDPGLSGPAATAESLKHLHRLPRPRNTELAQLDPFAGMAAGIAAARILDADERNWLTGHLAELSGRWDSMPLGRPWCVIRGSAPLDELIVIDGAMVIPLALERAVIGPPEWDLVRISMELWSFGWRTAPEYAEFCQAYGQDVTRWPGCYLLRDIQEFRMVVEGTVAAAADPGLRGQSAHRLACIRGDVGPRPWPGWVSIDQ